MKGLLSNRYFLALVILVSIGLLGVISLSVVNKSRKLSDNLAGKQAISRKLISEYPITPAAQVSEAIKSLAITEEGKTSNAGTIHYNGLLLDKDASTWLVGGKGITPVRVVTDLFVPKNNIALVALSNSFSQTITPTEIKPGQWFSLTSNAGGGIFNPVSLKIYQTVPGGGVSQGKCEYAYCTGWSCLDQNLPVDICPFEKRVCNKYKSCSSSCQVDSNLVTGPGMDESCGAWVLGCSTGNCAIAQATPGPLSTQNGNIVRTVDKIPSEIRDQKKVEKYVFEGEQKVREYAVVEKIVAKNTEYLLALDSGPKVTVVIAPGTNVSDALFGYNEDGLVVSVSYEQASTEDLSRIKAGDRVSVGYLEKYLTGSKITKLEEFVMLE